jgi:hypothetical protein
MVTVEVLIIGNTPAFGRVTAMAVKSHRLQQVNLRHCVFADLGSILTPGLIRGTELFIVELWRVYRTGLRAEGLAVAEELLRQGATPLIVSPLSIGEDAQTLYYWDLSSPDRIGERCANLLQRGGSGKDRQGLKLLRTLLDAYYEAPAGHDGA